MLMLLLAFALLATWGVGLALIASGSGTNTLYLTLIMISVAEILSFMYVSRVAEASFRDGNIPFLVGGLTMLCAYWIALVILTVAAVYDAAFVWLLTLHLLCLFGFLVGWTIVRFAIHHAKSNGNAKPGK